MENKKEDKCKELQEAYIKAGKKVLESSKTTPIEWNDVGQIVSFIQHASWCNRCSPQLNALRSLFQLVSTPFEINYIIETLRLANEKGISSQEVVKVFKEWAAKKGLPSH